MVAKLPPLLDARNVRHAVRISRCTCGCVLLRSDDDPQVTWTSGDWESEDQIGLRCSDRTCWCHRARVVDLRIAESRKVALRQARPTEAPGTPSPV
jgi:hypothetical protein